MVTSLLFASVPDKQKTCFGGSSGKPRCYSTSGGSWAPSVFISDSICSS